MKILLVAPASGRWRHIGRRGLFTGTTFRFSLLSLLTVAAETPDQHDVRLLDEQVETLDPETITADLVGITCMTAAAPRAYQLAARFRQRGIPVILGGMHPTLCPDEAQQHADAIVVGDAEGVWPQLLRDVSAGCLRQVYRAAAPPALERLKPLPRHLLPAGAYATVQAVQATRGCPNTCEFCSVAAFHACSQRQRPVEEVRREVAALPGRYVVFVDDNLTAERDYAMALFAALRPLKKRWIAQSDLRVARDPAFVAAMAQAGCVGLFVGLETFREYNLTSVSKTCHRVGEYRQALDLLHRHGIAVEAGIVFGFDGDTAATFQQTLQILDDLQVDAIQVSIFTPLPGTPRYRQLATRVVDRDWEHYDFHHVVFQPAGLSAEQLQDGHDWVTAQYYRPWRILRRVIRHLRRPRCWAALPFVVTVNLAYLGRVIRWGIRGRNPAMGAQAALSRQPQAGDEAAARSARRTRRWRTPAPTAPASGAAGR